MRTMDQLLSEHPFFAGLGDEALTLLAGCARNVHVDADEYLFHEGDEAREFFLVRHGRVALEVHAPGPGRLVIETVDDGDVLGWSWLVAPHRMFTDARAVVPSSVTVLDGTCLREKCEADPALGYLVLQRVAGVMYQRLQAARVRLLDLYGASRAAVR
jgi:CRP-like cAMP-binding protein